MSAAGDRLSAAASAAQHRTTTMLINLGSRVPFTDSFPVCQATRKRWLCTRRSSFCWEKERLLKLFSSPWRPFEQKLCSLFCTEMIRPDRARPRPDSALGNSPPRATRSCALCNDQILESWMNVACVCDAWNTAVIDRENVLARSERACRWFWNETWNF